MNKEPLSLFDTTLRDGAQTVGVDFSLHEKKEIAFLLDSLGMDYVEGGYPGANPLDTAFFADPPHLLNARLTAFGMTKRPQKKEDPGFDFLLRTPAPVLCFVCKAWDYHVTLAIGCAGEENLRAIEESVAEAVDKGYEVIVDCEHFFDGYKSNAQYALACAEAAFRAGCRWVVLCDTNGGTTPQEVSAIVAETTSRVPGENLGVHAHNDMGQAVANSLAAVMAGARHIQGTINGVGERCGNADMTTLIATLSLKPLFAERFTIGTTPDALLKLTPISRQFDEILNRPANAYAPYVGAAAFSTKAGIHASAILKNPQTYEHVDPAAIGNKRQILVSAQAGKSNLITELNRLHIPVEKNDPRLDALLDVVKRHEAIGYAYDSATASFYLLARRFLKILPEFFTIEHFNVNVNYVRNADATMRGIAEATVSVKIDGEEFLSTAKGDGPINALDQALRKDLGRYQEHMENLRLVNYRVRIFDSGTNATTRVSIESIDETSQTWTTVGVSTNIIEASFEALRDSLTYKLLKDGVQAANPNI